MSIFESLRASNDRNGRREVIRRSVICKLCQPLPPPVMGARFTVFLDKPAMQPRWIAGTAPHKSGRCRD